MALYSDKETPMAKYRTHLEKLRKDRGLSRMDIVRSMDISYPTVASWETKALDSMDAGKVNALAKLLGVTYDELVYMVEEVKE